MAEAGNDRAGGSAGPNGAASVDEARAVAEAARETEWTRPSFVAGLFMGRFDASIVAPFPDEDPAEAARAKPFLDAFRAFLAQYDADEVDRVGRISDANIQRLREIGALGMKVPREYGGLGLSMHAYTEAMSLAAARCGNLVALLSASQSIGVPQPLALAGTEEQKRRYFPRIAKGAITAFALTEPDVGSDPANMRTTATLADDGKSWIINGEKLWCTNGTRCELMVVMARTPDRIVGGKPRRQITAFIVEADSPGIEVLHHCRFMGLKALENGWIRFTDVRVPAENVLWGEGKGLKLALTTLNTGRLTIPAGVAGASKAILRWVRDWAVERVQWGQPVGKHDAVAQKIARMAADTFALDAVSSLTTGLHERGADIRLEAAIAKMWNTENGWRIVDDALQIRGGRGYETADSLRARGEPPIPIERMMRDARINLIFEGSSEIMRLFIAREAVDHHFSMAFPIVAPDSTLKQRLSALFRAAPFYAMWYPSLWVPVLRKPPGFGPLAHHARYVARAAKRLGRALFHAMLRFGPGLEKRQMVLFRAVDIGAELYAMTAACAKAASMAASGGPGSTADAAAASGAVELADAFCRQARGRIEALFDALSGAHDIAMYRLAQRVLAGEHAWLEHGIVDEAVESAARRAHAALNQATRSRLN
ncbi:MAG: acyl-CoA dehydrogenase family protein [Gemmatimonadaceae bacterium]|nr:acyl-CoA dehydrogenase family protein [Gemmatimonadaceae bacterium]